MQVLIEDVTDVPQKRKREKSRIVVCIAGLYDGTIHHVEKVS